jgi:hypothetical protein
LKDFSSLLHKRNDYQTDLAIVFILDCVTENVGLTLSIECVFSDSSKNVRLHSKTRIEIFGEIKNGTNHFVEKKNGLKFD